jgi:outer membrane protein
MNNITIMKNLAKIISIVLFAFTSLSVSSQQLKRLSLEEVIRIAEDQSPNALMAKHRFRASYWQYRTFVAEYRPSLSLSGTLPEYNRIFEKVYNSQTGQEEYVEKNTNNASLSAQLSQNIGLTGGNIFVQSDLTRFDVLGAGGRTQYISSPVSIGVTQPLFRYNSLKWQKKTEPVRYEQAKKRYISDIESVHSLAVDNFFRLALAQINKEIAEMNYFNSDTLYRIAQGRYNLGTIAEDELLQLELSFLNAGSQRNEAAMTLRDRELKLRSFLGYNENVRLELDIPLVVPELRVEVGKVIELALENNPTILQQKLTLLQAESSVAQAKADMGINANLSLSYGLRQQSALLPDVYKDPSNPQRVRLSLTMPIVDWGLSRGRYRMAQSSQELSQVQVAQALTDFEQNIILDVEQFNLQNDQVRIAAKSDEVAARRYEVTKQRFLIGRIDVLELNDADTRKDQNRRNYIQAIQNYWSYYYNMRSLTLYDFENNRPLDADFDKLVR